jgi:hypothetical protein
MKDNPLVIVLKLVIADPELRHLFVRSPGKVFKMLGLGCPIDMVGRRGNFCPVMPKLPDGEAAYDIEHEYWAEWLSGGLDQLSSFRRIVGDAERYPSRSTFESKQAWIDFVSGLKEEITSKLEELHRSDSDVY